MSRFVSQNIFLSEEGEQQLSIFLSVFSYGAKKKNNSDGHYGLYLDDTLYDGSSAPCPTFNNEPLCSSGPKKAGTVTVEFECVGLEVWGMGP